jgi:SnoaL-like polyketide cyclase
MAETDEATRNDNAERRWIEEIDNNRNSAVVDELVSPELVEHPLWYNSWLPPSMESKSPLEMVKAACEVGDPNFEDRRISVDEMFSVGDRVVTIGTTTAKRDGKTMSWKGVSISRYRDGKCVEVSYLYDRLGMYQQLGVVAETPELRKMAGLKD